MQLGTENEMLDQIESNKKKKKKKTASREFLKLMQQQPSQVWASS